MGVIYLDGSALCRFLPGVRHFEAWNEWVLPRLGDVVTTQLGLTELRQAAGLYPRDSYERVMEIVDTVRGQVATIRFDDDNVTVSSHATAVLKPFAALHLGAAVADSTVDSIATYDPALAHVAELYQLTVIAPGLEEGWHHAYDGPPEGWEPVALDAPYAPGAEFAVSPPEDEYEKALRETVIVSPVTEVLAVVPADHDGDVEPVESSEAVEPSEIEWPAHHVETLHEEPTPGALEQARRDAERAVGATAAQDGGEEPEATPGERVVSLPVLEVDTGADASETPLARALREAEEAAGLQARAEVMATMTDDDSAPVVDLAVASEPESPDTPAADHGASERQEVAPQDDNPAGAVESAAAVETLSEAEAGVAPAPAAQPAPRRAPFAGWYQPRIEAWREAAAASAPTPVLEPSGDADDHAEEAFVDEGGSQDAPEPVLRDSSLAARIEQKIVVEDFDDDSIAVPVLPTPPAPRPAGPHFRAADPADAHPDTVPIKWNLELDEPEDPYAPARFEVSHGVRAGVPGLGTALPERTVVPQAGELSQIPQFAPFDETALDDLPRDRAIGARLEPPPGVDVPRSPTLRVPRRDDAPVPGAYTPLSAQPALAPEKEEGGRRGRVKRVKREKRRRGAAEPPLAESVDEPWKPPVPAPASSGAGEGPDDWSLDQVIKPGRG